MTDPYSDAEEEVKGALDSVSHYESARGAAEHRRSSDRSLIVTIVVCLYAGAVGLAVVYLFVHGIFWGEAEFSSMMEIVKVAILPVLTLVIGYYFGTKAND